MVILATTPILAHPLGPFTIDRYSRLHISRDAVSLHYIIDMAEIPTAEELLHIDADHNRRIAPEEERGYAERTVRDFARRLKLEVNGRALEWRVDSSAVQVVQAAERASGSFPTMRITADMSASIPNGLQIHSVRYEDGNFIERAGWKEIVANAADELDLIRSSVPQEDLSAKLTRFPSDALLAPPQAVHAELTFGAVESANSAIHWTALALSLLATAAVFAARRLQLSRLAKTGFRL